MRNHIVELNLNYGTSSFYRSCIELILTFFAYGVAFTGLAMSTNVCSRVFFIIFFTLIVLRIFMIQHDCGHHSFFKSKNMNNFIGHCCSIFTLTPFNYWRKTHNYHHTHFGISGESDLGYIDILSVEEFRNKNEFKKWRYVLTRSPLFLLFFAAPFFFMIVYRFPSLLKILFKKLSLANLTRFDYVEFYILDGLVIVMLGAFFYFFGGIFFINYIISLYFASAIGILLFYIQHNIENLYYVSKAEWSTLDQGLKGSSFLRLPSILRWFTANIGYHHIHHLCLKIPFYKLPKVHRLHSDKYTSITTIGIRNIPYLLRLKLYDKNQKKMITWQEYKKLGSDL